MHTKRYYKQVRDHHIQMDIKFLTFRVMRGEKVRRFQFTAIDDATRVRALKIYEKHTQTSAIDFVDHVIKGFPFRIRDVRTDNGHEFQAKFHWYVENQGGRPPFDAVTMFKVLVLQALYDLSADRAEFIINYRPSFMRFLGLGLSDKPSSRWTRNRSCTYNQTGPLR